MMKNIIIISFLVFTSSINGQVNLIKNPSLETWTKSVSEPLDWKAISYTPDFYKSDLRMFWQSSIESHKFRSKFPKKGHDGLCYFGIDRREIVQGILKETLKQGKEYLLSCWVYKPDIYTENVLDKFTIRFSPDSLKQQTYYLNVKEGYELFKTDRKSVKEHQWQFISTSFIAKGNEKYFQVGFFNGLLDGATIVYYLFDDFQLTEIEQYRETKSIYFDNNIDSLNSDQKTDIKEYLSAFIKMDSVVLIGHADDLGDETSNFNLSLNRGIAIQNFLTRYISNEKIKTIPRGDKDSKGKNRKDFRKVDIKIYHSGKINLPENIIQFDSSLMLTLKNLQYKDQYYRIIEDSLIRCCSATQAENLKMIEKQMSIQDTINLVQLKEIIEIYGYPGLSLVSPDYMNVAVMIILHSDQKTQEKYVDLIKQEAENKEITYTWYPYLVDKIQIGKKQEQEFGTQCDLDRKINQFILLPTRDLKTLDIRRRKYGLQPYRDYLKSMNKGLKPTY